MAQGELARKDRILAQLRSSDEGKTGFVQTNVFFNILACCDVALGEPDEEDITTNHVTGGKVRYEAAMARLRFDTTRDEWLYSAAHGATGNL